MTAVKLGVSHFVAPSHAVRGNNNNDGSLNVQMGVKAEVLNDK